MKPMTTNLKKCLKCGKEKPLDRFYFYHFKGKPNGYYVSPCKQCKNKRRAEYRRANPEKTRRQNYLYTKKYRAKKRIYRSEIKLKEELKIWGIDPPEKLSDCKNHPEPCPWVRCKYHLIWDIHPPKIKKKDNKEILDYLFKMPLTCLFDYTNSGHTLEDVAQLFGITRERVRQIQDKALNRIKRIKSRREQLIDFKDHEDRHPIDPGIYISYDF